MFAGFVVCGLDALFGGDVDLNVWPVWPASLNLSGEWHRTFYALQKTDMFGPRS